MTLILACENEDFNSTVGAPIKTKRLASPNSVKCYRKPPGIIPKVAITFASHFKTVNPNPQTEIPLTQIHSRKGFEALFREHYDGLCTYVYFYLKDRAASEEVVQELFFNLWKKREELEITTSVKSYLYKSARNHSLNVIKHIEVRENYKKLNEEQRSEAESHSHHDMEVGELQARISKAIDKLPPERQKIFMMSRYEDLKYREIADKLDLSVKTVEAQMGKALKFLREELADYLPLWMFILFFVE